MLEKHLKTDIPLGVAVGVGGHCLDLYSEPHIPKCCKILLLFAKVRAIFLIKYNYTYSRQMVKMTAFAPPTSSVFLQSTYTN